MTLSQIEIFIELAKEKNFSTTAKRLGITQSAVSHSVSKLEKELGVNLISRKRKQFQITEKGSNILLYFQEIQRQLRNIDMEVSLDRTSQKQTLRIGTLWSISNTILPKLLSSFKRRFPMLDITSIVGTDDEIEGWLESGAIDIAIFSRRSGQHQTKQLTEDRFYVALPETHPYANAKKLKIQEIKDLPYIMSKGGCEPLINSITDPEGITLNTKFEAIEVITILTMVRENLGISLVPELAIPKDVEHVVFVPLDTNLKRIIYIAVQSESKLKKNYTKEFIQLAQRLVPSFLFAVRICTILF